MNRASLAVLAALVALAAVVAGCGSDSETTESLTKVEFIKRADAICEKNEGKVTSEFEDYAEEKGWDENKEPSKEQQEEAIVEVVGPNVQAQVDEIRELGAPEGDEETIDEMLTAVEEGVERIEEEPQLLTEEAKNPLAEGSKLARDYGLEKCGEE